MQVIMGGVDAFNAMLYGEQSVDNRAFFQQQIQRLPSLGIMGDVGTRFAEVAQQTYDRWNGSRAMQLMRTAAQQLGSLFQPEQVRNLFDMVDFQTASITMQRWIMADEVVRAAYHNQTCDGYSDTYVDLEPGKIGEAHYDWRRVNDGVMKFDEGDSYVVKQYMEPLRKGDKPLANHQKAAILSTQNVARIFFDKKEKDPTSQYNTDL